MSANKRKTLTRAMAFFLCIVMVIGLLIQVLPTSLFVGNIVNAEESNTQKYGFNTKCNGKHAPSPKGYCLDIGYGLCLPYEIDFEDPKTKNKVTAYLYEGTSEYEVTLSLLDKGIPSVSGDYGQYFYWPVKWKTNPDTGTGTNKYPIDITDLSQISDINAAKKVPRLREDTGSDGWTNYSAYTNWFKGGGSNDKTGRNWPVNEDGLAKRNFKSLENSHPLNYWVADWTETEALGTAFINYNGLKVMPRWILNSNGDTMGYFAFPSDTWKNKPENKKYIDSDSIVSFPGLDPTFSFQRGTINKEFMQPNSKGDFYWTKTYDACFSWMSAEDIKASGSSYKNTNTTVKYLDPDKAPNQEIRNKILALFETVKAYEAFYGVMDVDISMKNPEKYPKIASEANDIFENRKLIDFFSKYLKTSNPQSGWCGLWCPGPLTIENVNEVPQSYIYASLTAKAALLLRFFEVNGYSGGGGYSTAVVAQAVGGGAVTNYTNYHLPKFSGTKDLTMWGGLEQSLEEEQYNASIWEPKEEYKEIWESLGEEGNDEQRTAKLEEMSWQEFLVNFSQVNPETKKQDDGSYQGGLLQYDYPYVWVNSLSLKDNGTPSQASSSFNGEFKTLWSWHNLGSLKTGAKAIYDRNQKALKGEGASSDRTVALMGKTLESYPKANIETTFNMPEAMNNKSENNQGRIVMSGDSLLVGGNADILLNGGRLWAFNVSPWSGKLANVFNHGSGKEDVANKPISDEENKVINVNIYKTVARTPKVETIWGSAKPDKTNPAFIAFSALLSEDAENDKYFYQKGGAEGAEKINALKSSILGINTDLYKILANDNDNSNLNNDTATVVYMMGDASDNKRNLVLHSATVRTEDGAQYDFIDVQPEKNTYNCYLPDITEEQAQRGEFKNYYVDWEMQYQNLNPKKLPTKSIQTDLGTIGYYKQNIKALNDSNGENYETSTNLKSYWDITGGLDIGKYNSPVSAKGYNQATSAYDNRVVPMAELAKLAYEKETGIATADYIIQIPRKYDNEDNTNLSDWETLKIHFEQKVAKKDEVDNAVTKILLHDQTHPGTTFVGDPNAEVAIHIGCTYNAEIVVSRIAGTKPETNLNDRSAVAFDGTNPILKTNSMVIRGIVGTVPIGKVGTGETTGKEFVFGVYDDKKNSSGILARPNDTMSYTLSNLTPTDTGYIEIRAFFNPKDYREDNNYMIAKFGGAADYVLENLELTQDIINLPPNQSQTTDVRINFSAEIGLNYDRESDPNGKRDPTLIGTTVAVLMFEKGPNDFTYTESSGRVVWLDNNVQLSPNVGPRPISGTLGYGATPQSQGSPISFRKDYSYRFIAVINAGNSTANGNLSDSFDHRFRNKVAQTFMKETDNHNNESQKEVTVIAPIPPTEIKPNCWDKKTGLCNKAHTRNSWTVTFYYTECPIAVYYTCCSGKPTTCRTCCYGSGCRSWTTAKTFQETFEIQGWFRSVDTNEQWVRASSNAAVVRAGHWFDFKAVTIYNTDRGDMPPPDPYGGCAYLVRSPGYSQPSAYRQVRIVMDNSTGGQRKIYNSFKSGWVQEFMPQRYTVPETTKNLTITFTVDVDEFRGYWVDREHPKVELCDCTTYTMKVQNPLPVIDGSTSIW